MTMPRQKPLQDFVDAVLPAFIQSANDPASQASLARITNALRTPAEPSGDSPVRLPVCDHLAQAADPARFADPHLRAIARSFLSIEPLVSPQLLTRHTLYLWS